MELYRDCQVIVWLTYAKCNRTQHHGNTNECADLFLHTCMLSPISVDLIESNLLCQLIDISVKCHLTIMEGCGCWSPAKNTGTRNHTGPRHTLGG